MPNHFVIAGDGSGVWGPWQTETEAVEHMAGKGWQRDEYTVQATLAVAPPKKDPLHDYDEPTCGWSYLQKAGVLLLLAAKEGRYQFEPDDVTQIGSNGGVFTEGTLACDYAEQARVLLAPFEPPKDHPLYGGLPNLGFAGQYAQFLVDRAVETACEAYIPEDFN